MFLSVLPAQKPPPGTVVEGELGQQLDAALQRVRPDFWGAVLVAAQGKVVLAKGCGMADFAKAPCGPRSLFDVGTLCNQVTVAAALVLIGERKLALDTPLGKVLRDWPADKAAITVEHLIRHTSGLPPEADWGGNAGAALRPALAAVGRCKLVDKPGRAFRFSHLNSCVLAMVIEEASGARFERYVEERVFKPLGMTEAGFLGEPRLDEKRMTWRRKDGGKGQPCGAGTLNWQIRGARGLIASVHDVHAFAQAAMAERLPDAAGARLLWSPLAGGEAYQVSTAKVGGSELVQVQGQTDGYRARLLLHQASRSCIVVLSGAQAQLDPVVQALAGALVAAGGMTGPGAAAPAPDPATEPPAEPKPEPEPGPVPGLGPDALARFSGSFALPGGGVFRVAVQGHGLLLTGEGLQGAARAVHGRWPPAGLEQVLRTAEDRGLALLSGLIAGERTAFADAFASDEASLAARATWDDLVSTWGPASAPRLLGTETGEAAKSWFAVRFGQHETRLVTPWSGAKFSSLRVVTAALPFTMGLHLVRADAAVGKTRTGQEVTVTMEGEGAQRRLVFEDVTGLIECPLLPD